MKKQEKDLMQREEERSAEACKKIYPYIKSHQKEVTEMLRAHEMDRSLELRIEEDYSFLQRKQNGFLIVNSSNRERVFGRAYWTDFFDNKTTFYFEPGLERDFKRFLSKDFIPIAA
ncbi:hypothetical protein J4408_00415 [Candidatus Pacearchaeota archaeon]|nr:hypothetical protein [Candidatus Pacearchaeota archaeon]